jgi:SAM-dependent methyltransferase
VTTANIFREVWDKGNYRLGSCAQRMVPIFQQYIPKGSVINDYGSGTGRAEVDLLKLGYKVNMVDFADNALEDEARVLIGERLTYTIAPLEELPADFPVADWGICIGVLMLINPALLQTVFGEIRRTCRNLIMEVYDFPDIRLGIDWTVIKGDAEFWKGEAGKHWQNIEQIPSPESHRRYILICRESK